jgi:hypothetical protein
LILSDELQVSVMHPLGLLFNPNVLMPAHTALFSNVPCPRTPCFADHIPEGDSG